MTARSEQESPVARRRGMWLVLKVGGPLALALLVVAIPFAAQSPGQIPDGFTRIFNGKDLAGWHPSRTAHHGKTPRLTVKDGAVYILQNPFGQGGVLLTRKKYGDFEFYVETDIKPGFNSGIFLRSTKRARRTRWSLTPTRATGRCSANRCASARERVRRAWPKSGSQTAGTRSDPHAGCGAAPDAVGQRRTDVGRAGAEERHDRRHDRGLHRPAVPFPHVDRPVDDGDAAFVQHPWRPARLPEHGDQGDQARGAMPPAPQPTSPPPQAAPQASGQPSAATPGAPGASPASGARRAAPQVPPPPPPGPSDYTNSVGMPFMLVKPGKMNAGR